MTAAQIAAQGVVTGVLVAGKIGFFPPPDSCAGTISQFGMVLQSRLSIGQALEYRLRDRTHVWSDFVGHKKPMQN